MRFIHHCRKDGDCGVGELALRYQGSQAKGEHAPELPRARPSFGRAGYAEAEAEFCALP